MSPVVAILYLL